MESAMWPMNQSKEAVSMTVQRCPGFWTALSQSAGSRESTQYQKRSLTDLRGAGDNEEKKRIGGRYGTLRGNRQFQGRVSTTYLMGPAGSCRRNIIL